MILVISCRKAACSKRFIIKSSVTLFMCFPVAVASSSQARVLRLYQQHLLHRETEECFRSVVLPLQNIAQNFSYAFVQKLRHLMNITNSSVEGSDRMIITVFYRAHFFIAF